MKSITGARLMNVYLMNQPWFEAGIEASIVAMELLYHHGTQKQKMMLLFGQHFSSSVVSRQGKRELQALISLGALN